MLKWVRATSLLFALLCWNMALEAGSFTNLQAGSFSNIQLGNGVIQGTSGFCTTNGSDGQAAAPASTTPQFSTLLSGYAATPSWCVAGVGFAVGYTPNASNSGNTITETGVLNAPVTNDKKSFYANAGGSLPSGITQGTAFFLCSVSGSAGTFTYSLSTTTGCGAPVTLSSNVGSFVALKIPNATTNTPTGTSGWNGADCGSGITFAVCITANNPTIDHFDFSTNGGWGIFFSSNSGITVTNNYFFMGTNLQSFIFDEGNGPSNTTISNNIVDGNAVTIFTTTTQSLASGTTINVASTAGIFAGQTICDTTATSAISCPTTLVQSVGAGTITLNATATSVGNGDTIAISSGPNVLNSLGRQPGLSFVAVGTMTAQYNWIRNTFSEHWQNGTTATHVTNTSMTFKYNVFENTGWGSALSSTVHGDVVQIYGLTGSTYGPLTFDYNTVIQNNVHAESDSGALTANASGLNGALASTADISNNVGVFPLGSGTTLTSNFGLFVINPSFYTPSMNFQNNYVDPTSACPGTPSGCGAAAWALTSTTTGGSGPDNPSCTSINNINMKTGVALPKPAGSFC